jgi:single-strand DNA-binding protein
MINSAVIVGRVVERPEKLKSDKGVTFGILTLAVQRPFKNMEGDYDTDFIKCLLWEGIVENCCEFCTKGSIVGVRGRLQTRTSEVLFKEESKNISRLDLIAERVSFIRMVREEGTNKEINVAESLENN